MSNQSISFWPKRNEVLEEPVVRIRTILRHTQTDFLTLIKKTNDEGPVDFPACLQGITPMPTHYPHLASITSSSSVISGNPITVTPFQNKNKSVFMNVPPKESFGGRRASVHMYSRRRATKSSMRAVSRVLKGFNDPSGRLNMTLVTNIIEDLDRCINQVNFIPREGLSTKVAPTIKKTVNAMKLQRRLSKQDDAQVAGFLTELLNLGIEADPQNKHRQSIINDTAVMVVQPITYMLGIYGMVMPIEKEREINNALMRIENWDLDIFKIKEMTEGLPLTCVTYRVLQERCMFDTFSISPRVMVNFLMKVEEKYNDVPYSNSLHAADVVHNAHIVLGAANINPSEVECLSVLLACAVHAMDHPGLTNQYLVLTENPLADLYNNISVIQNNSCHQWLSVLTEKDCNVLGTMNKEDKARVKLLVKDLVMATCMGQYVAILTEMHSIAEKKVQYSQEDESAEQYEIRLPMMCAVIHCCDIANSTKPLNMYLKWVEALKTEFFNQGDYELQRGLQISPMCDREKVDFNKCQVGLIDIVILPVWAALSSFCSPDLNPMMLQMSRNRNVIAGGVETDRNASRADGLHCGEGSGQQDTSYNAELFSKWGREEAAESSVDPGSEIISLLSSEVFTDNNNNKYDTQHNSVTDDDDGQHASGRCCRNRQNSILSHDASDSPLSHNASNNVTHTSQTEHRWTWNFSALLNRGSSAGN